MNLIKTQDSEGYLLEDIRKELKPAKWQELQDWLQYSPLSEYKNKPMVYKEDWDNFKATTK